MAQVRLRNFTGEEFRLNYRKDLETHLLAYARANLRDRAEVTAQFDRGYIDSAKQTLSERVTFDRDKHRLTDCYEAALGLIESLVGVASPMENRYCQIDRPFAHPYYWAAFTCQGLA